METPKKIYLTQTEDGTPYYTERIPFERDDFIEYVCTEAFIRKARKYFIKELPNFRSFMESGTAFIKNFESFMKGE